MTPVHYCTSLTTSCHTTYESINKCLWYQRPFFQKHGFYLLAGPGRAVKLCMCNGSSKTIPSMFNFIEVRRQRKTIHSANIIFKKSSTVWALWDFALTFINMKFWSLALGTTSNRLQRLHRYSNVRCKYPHQRIEMMYEWPTLRIPLSPKSFDFFYEEGMIAISTFSPAEDLTRINLRDQSQLITLKITSPSPPIFYVQDWFFFISRTTGFFCWMQWKGHIWLDAGR